MFERALGRGGVKLPPLLPENDEWWEPGWDLKLKLVFYFFENMVLSLDIQIKDLYFALKCYHRVAILVRLVLL